MAEELRHVHVTIEIDTNKRTLTLSEVYDDIPSALEAIRGWADERLS